MLDADPLLAPTRLQLEPALVVVGGAVRSAHGVNGVRTRVLALAERARSGTNAHTAEAVFATF